MTDFQLAVTRLTAKQIGDLLREIGERDAELFIRGGRSPYQLRRAAVILRDEIRFRQSALWR